MLTGSSSATLLSITGIFWLKPGIEPIRLLMLSSCSVPLFSRSLILSCSSVMTGVSSSTRLDGSEISAQLRVSSWLPSEKPATPSVAVAVRMTSLSAGSPMSCTWSAPASAPKSLR